METGKPSNRFFSEIGGRAMTNDPDTSLLVCHTNFMEFRFAKVQVPFQLVMSCEKKSSLSCSGRQAYDKFYVKHRYSMRRPEDRKGA
jgi:hypothetical protein